MTAHTSTFASRFTFGSALALVLCVGLMAVGLLAPQESAAADKAEASKTAGKSRIPMFLQKNRGSPKTRLGGATRGSDDGIPRTEALVPEETGQTLKAQPVVYWYLSEDTTHRIDFTLIGVDPVNPIMETTLKGDFKAGIQQIRLEDFDISLKEGVSYQWFVNVVPHPDQRLHDRIIGGGIERLAPTAELQSKLDAAPATDAHFILAEAGLWYDALDSLSQQIQTSPGDAGLEAQRAALFDQAGLGKLN